MIIKFFKMQVFRLFVWLMTRRRKQIGTRLLHCHCRLLGAVGLVPQCPVEPPLTYLITPLVMRQCLTATAVIPSDRRLYKVLHSLMGEKAASIVDQVSSLQPYCTDRVLKCWPINSYLQGVVGQMCAADWWVGTEANHLHFWLVQWIL